jgi:hypothetical protein
MNQTGCRSLDRIANDPRVLEIVRESGTTSDSRYCYTMTLARGWHADGCHYPCENSIRELIAAFRRVTVCSCQECVDDHRCYITTNGRRRYFDTVADAARVASEIFKKTGTVVGMNQEAKTATDSKGQKVVVGDTVRAINPRDDKPTGPPVRVTSIHRQGFDGTILTTDPAPESDYPHHFSRAAKHCVRVDQDAKR